jgi:SAM-dependent methyltransferase
MIPPSLSRYVCPRCRGGLVGEDGRGLACGPCRRVYPIIGGIPDFVLSNLAASPHVVLRRVGWFDRLARIYDLNPTYPLVLRIYAGWRVSYADMIGLIIAMMAGVSGTMVDVACGPGTLGRRLAGPAREFYGVDMSWGMLRQGAALASRENISSIHFARALAEALPFPEGSFDAGLCGAALHLLSNPLYGLREIGRTLKPGAPLAATTILAGKKGLFRFRAFREHALAVHGIRSFTVPELQRLTVQAGFADFEPHIFGSLIVFRVRKPEGRGGIGPGGAA